MNCVLMSPRMDSRKTIQASTSTFTMKPCTSRSLAEQVELCSEDADKCSSSSFSEKQTETKEEVTLKEKNIKFVEELFNQSQVVMNETLKKFKTDLNRLTFDNATFISTLKKKTKIKHSKYRNNSIFCKVNDLNKLTRLKNLVANDIESGGGNSKTNLKTQKQIIKIGSGCSPQKTAYNLKATSSSKIVSEQKRILPISLELRAEKTGTIDSVPGVKLTWNLVKMSDQIEQSQANIKSYEILCYKEYKNADASSKPSWTHIDSVKAHSLPAYCNLNDFEIDCKYYFCIRTRYSDDSTHIGSNQVDIDF